MARHPLLRALTLAGAALLVAAAVPAQISFTEVAASAGVQFHQESETVVPIGGGVVWADLDDDGDDDLFATQAIGCNRMFRNEGDGTFSEVPDAAGADACGATSHGVSAADYDNDGDQDLYVTAYGQNALYENRFYPDGGVSFVNVTAAAGMGADGEANSASASWGDYDNDGYLDLIVVNHAMTVPFSPGVCRADLLWHNDGDGTFTDVADETGIGTSGLLEEVGCGLATTWSDYDMDGDVDLMIINDFGERNIPNRLFRNDGPDGNGGWTFTDMSRATTFEQIMFGMGIGVSDINGDGFFDYYMSDIGPNNLMMNIGGEAFSEVAAFAGVLAFDRHIFGGDGGLVSWGNVFMDANSDGREELFVANGGSPGDKWPDMFGKDYQDQNPNYAYATQGGVRFVEGHDAIGIDEIGYNRSVAVSDYDLDGDMDVYFGRMQGNNTLYRNDTPQSNSWLKVKAIGTTSNRDAIGAKIWAFVGNRTLVREVSGGSSFLSRNSLVAHFGLGNATVVDRLVVEFPSGAVEELTDVAVDQLVEVTE